MMVKTINPERYNSDRTGQAYSRRSAPKSASIQNYRDVLLKDDKDKVIIKFLTRPEVIDLKDTDALIAELAEKDAIILELKTKLNRFERRHLFKFDSLDLPTDYYENDIYLDR